MNSKNYDHETVKSFGDEWLRFDQSQLSNEELEKLFNNYFAIFPWEQLPPNDEGFDMGCGSGRWAQFVAPRVNHLHCIDPSDAILVAKKNLINFNNVSFHHNFLDDVPLAPNSQDFGYAIGVLHHIPNTLEALRSCVRLLKPEAPLLIYIYYSFDNRPFWFRIVWQTSNYLRKTISHLPPKIKSFLTDLIAVCIYLPLARFSALLEKFGLNVENIPLSYYRHCSFYTMRTDARDRFGTPLEQRFSRSEIEAMMLSAGLKNIKFHDSPPYWCAVGFKQEY